MKLNWIHKSTRIMLGKYQKFILFTNMELKKIQQINLIQFYRQTVNGTVTYTFDSPKKVRGKLNDVISNVFYDDICREIKITENTVNSLTQEFWQAFYGQ